MACLLVPAAEAVITTIASKVMRSKEKAHEAVPETVEIQLDGGHIETAEKTPFSHKLKWLSNLLWGGSGLLALEHIWHGEIVPVFPFLTAAENPADMAEMLHEMSTVGVTMSAVVTAVWLGMVAVSSAIEKRALKESPATTEES